MNITNFGSSRRRVHLDSAITSIPLGSFKTWVTKVDAFASEVLVRLVRVETRLDHTGDRLDRMDARLDHMDTRLDRMDARLDGMDIRLNSMNTRLDNVDGRLDGIDTRLDQMTSIFHKSIISLTLRLITFVCGFGTTLVMATYFVATHAK